MNYKLHFLVGSFPVTSGILSLVCFKCALPMQFWCQSKRGVYRIWGFPLVSLALSCPDVFFHCHSFPGFIFLVAQTRQFICFCAVLLMLGPSLNVLKMGTHVIQLPSFMHVFLTSLCSLVPLGCCFFFFSVSCSNGIVLLLLSGNGSFPGGF